jgi:hypothetical protein
MNHQAKWTFMVYLAGDNNLATAGEADLEEMRMVGSTREVNVVAQFDNAGDIGTTRYHLQRRGVGERPIGLGKTDSGSPEVLLAFVKWAIDEFPAQRYALVLWNHGNGWEPTEIDRVAEEVDARDYDGRDLVVRGHASLRNVFFRTTLERILRLPSMTERAICMDDGSGHSIDTVELGAVLQRITAMLGKPLDLLGMDACLMSTLEVAYQARSYACCVVASEELEPAAGWPYHVVLRALTQCPDMPTAELATRIVHAYVRSYAQKRSNASVTQAALDLAHVEVVASAADDLADALIHGLPATASEVWNALRTTTSFYSSTLWDLGHLCVGLADQTRDAAVRRTARVMVQALAPGNSRFVLAQSHRGQRVERCTGVSVYLPALVDISSYYSDVEFARLHHWLSFLKAYKAA